MRNLAIVALAAAMLPAINAWPAETETEETPPTKVEVTALPQVQFAESDPWICAQIGMHRTHEGPHGYYVYVSEENRDIECSAEHPDVVSHLEGFHPSYFPQGGDEGSLQWYTTNFGNGRKACTVGQYFIVHTFETTAGWLNTALLRSIAPSRSGLPNYWRALDMRGNHINFYYPIEHAECLPRPGATP